MPELMPAGFEPRPPGPIPDPCWQMAESNPGVWVKTELQNPRRTHPAGVFESRRTDDTWYIRFTPTEGADGD